MHYCLLNNVPVYTHAQVIAIIWMDFFFLFQVDREDKELYCGIRSQKQLWDVMLLIF